MVFNRWFVVFLVCLTFGWACQNTASIDLTKYYLKPITVQDFAYFVQQTNYITDAEKFGWSILQKNVFEFEVIENANWRIPNGIDSAKVGYPVSQVSYNDALAYCKWSDTRLPTYNEYWEFTNKDKRTIAFDTTAFALATSANIRGNFWEITHATDPMKVRLAGGSIFCNTTTCNGTAKDRALYVDAVTGNIHISFAIVEEKNK